MASEKVTLYRTNEAKTEAIEQLPKTVTSQVYDVENGKFLDETLNDIEQQIVTLGASIGGGGEGSSTVISVAGKTGEVILTSTDVGLGNVTNESKATMFTSPTFTGTPTAPTPATTTDNTQISTTAFVKTAINTITGTLSDLTTTVKTSIVTAINSLKTALDSHTSNTTSHTTSTEKSTWNGKYTKPTTGIPKTDLETAVQTSLGKADTAIQTIADASTTVKGLVQLNNTLSSTSTIQASTAAQVKLLNDYATTHIASKATTTQLGHVMVDGSTIVADSNGKISAVGGGGANLGVGTIFVKDVGAVGDGVTDDASAINNAITTLSNQGGGTLRFDGGTYAIGSTIAMKSNVILKGVPYKTVILTKTNTFDAITYNTETSNTQIDGFIIRNTGGINADARNSGIYYGRFTLINNNLRNVRIVEFFNGIDARTYWKNSLVDNVIFSRCRTSINVEHTESHNVSTVTFLNLFSENPTYRHLKILYAEGFTFVGCRFQGDGTLGYSVDLIGCYMNFQNCRFDGMDSTADGFSMLAASLGSRIDFNNCHVIDYNSTASNTALFEALTGSRITINNLGFEESTGFTYTFRVDANSQIMYSNAKLTGMPVNSVASGGMLVDIDNALTSGGGAFEWRFNPTTNSLDLVVLP